MKLQVSPKNGSPKMVNFDTVLIKILIVLYSGLHKFVQDCVYISLLLAQTV